MTIKTLFDGSKDIYRTIEKVITYDAAQEARLKAEIEEYVVTASIDEQFERLLERMQTAMEYGGQHEIGVWVSGFYGSGKSSFTKYLGMALDQQVCIEDRRFLDYLADRLIRPQTRALLYSVANRFPAAVVMLDLASEMLAGATQEEVSTVLYYKVLQWAGYSRNLKVAALERRIRKDGRADELEALVQSTYQTGWSDIHNDPLVVDTVVPDIAHQIYPQLFATPSSFTTVTSEFIWFEDERVPEMIDMVRTATGKEYVIFVVDEVGQYVGSRQNLILNLDGLAKNLKSAGDGQVWIIGTAQQTLTDDNATAALNSPELYKLKDRFPIQIDLDSRDIKEICYRRLLGKSPAGEQTLGQLFDQHGQALRHATRLQDAGAFDADFDRSTFINLYPFLPAHFSVLLSLLGALARSTGGIGLRSAIKVIQDILVEGPDGQQPVADRTVGWLASTVTLYDALEKDIARAVPAIHAAVEKVQLRFHQQPIHQDVAKTVAILQILRTMPVTVQNVSSLLHSDMAAASQREAVETAVKELIDEPLVPFGEKDGNLVFFSEKLNNIDQERSQLPVRGTDLSRYVNAALLDAFGQLPRVQLHNSLSVSTGLKVSVGATAQSLTGERETIQTLVDFVDPQEYEATRQRLIDESRQRSSLHTIFLIGRSSADMQNLARDIARARMIAERYRNDPDQEVREYCASQSDRANRLLSELQRLQRRLLSQGSFIFQGQQTAVDSLSQDVKEALRKHLAEVAARVFDRYSEAAYRAETALAEKFLRRAHDNLKAVDSSIDPLSLVQIVSGTPRVQSDHKALVSIRDYIERGGSVDGRHLLDKFGDAPFGWSQDTVRYLVAALLVAGDIKLKISGREVTANGQQAVEALRTNQTFKPVGVALRVEKTPMDVLARAAERLTELVGETVIPLEAEISKAAARHFPQLQLAYGPLATRLQALNLPGADNMVTLNQELAGIVSTDASDVPQLLGSSQSTLAENLKWARQVDTALQQGLEQTIRGLQEHCREISALPDSGVPGQLRTDLAEEMQQVGERLRSEQFYQHGADLSSTLTSWQNQVRSTVEAMHQAQDQSIRAAKDMLSQLADWNELSQSEQFNILGQLDQLQCQAAPDLAGLKHLVSQEFVIQSRAQELRQAVIRRAQERRQSQMESQKAQMVAEGKTSISRRLKLPATLTNTAGIDDLITQLRSLRNEVALYEEITVELVIE
jgi:hypothetical protein